MKLKFNKNIKIKRIIFTILLMITFYAIFNFSNQDGETSGTLSTKITEIIVTVLKQIVDSNQITVELLHPIIRKLAHYSIYTLSGFSIMGLICTYNIKDKFKILISLSLGIIYAISDELHQYFIPGRCASIKDVCIDSLGVITGICIIILIFRINNKK